MTDINAEPVGARPAGARPAGITPPGTQPPLEGATLGELFAQLASDFSTLARKEVELAKAEIKEEATKAGKGAGMLGGTGIAALFGIMMLSFAAAWGLAAAIPAGWAFLIVAVIWLAVAGVLFVNGKRELQRVRPPERTIETLQEDAQWVKHPTS